MAPLAARRQTAAHQSRRRRWTARRGALAAAVLAALWTLAGPSQPTVVPSARPTEPGLVFEVESPLTAKLVDLPGRSIPTSRRGEPCEVAKGVVVSVVGTDPAFGILASLRGSDGSAAACADGSTVFLTRPDQRSVASLRAALSRHVGDDMLRRAEAIRSAAIGARAIPASGVHATSEPAKDAQ